MSGRDRVNRCRDETAQKLALSLMEPVSALSTRELSIARVIDAPCDLIFKVWTTQLPLWWGPHGMTTTVREMDLRPGGAFRTVMRAPDGTEYPTKGVFLEVSEPHRIVFTDAFGPDWEPLPDIFFTAITTFEPLPGNKTRYRARALHWTVENRAKHEAMGFYQGWGESIDQLVNLVINQQGKAIS